LWIGGELSTLERLAMLSHVRVGHEYHLWVYEPIRVPRGVIVEDASRILGRASIFRYETGPGKGSVSAFSNVFRYRLLFECGGWWCDTDLVALKRFDFETDYVFASQVNVDGTVSAASGIIKAPRRSALMERCFEYASAVDRKTLEWGVIGPKLVEREIKAHDLERYIQPPGTFCPAHWFEAELYPPLHVRPLGPESYAVHLWHEMWRRGNFDKDAESPGSLYEALQAPYRRDLRGGSWLRRAADYLRRSALAISARDASLRFPASTP
jgi:hypothetical protein